MTEYTVKEFNEDKDQIKKAFKAGKREITLRGIEFTMHLQARNATWQTGGAGKPAVPVTVHKQREEWIIVKPKNKYKFVPVFSVENKNNMRSSKSALPKA